MSAPDKPLSRPQARVLLNLLCGRVSHAGRPSHDLVSTRWTLYEQDRMSFHPDTITPTGRTALASWLLRDLRGPYVAVESSMFWEDEALTLLAVLRGEALTDDAPIFRCRYLGWLNSRLRLTASGRDVLASYLLRGWKP